MSELNNSDAVKRQYSTSSSLNTRINIHAKYSTNKTGFGNWIFSNYNITDGMKVLELGCGTGDMWTGHEDLIKRCSDLIISDFSEGMVDTAKLKIGTFDNVEYKVIDIQNIPFEDDSFDVVIANMMLYHVPDLACGLSEVRRVLKDGGKFYTATFGEHGIMEYLAKVLGEYGIEDKTSRNFTLQNGKEKLESFFENVKRLDYEDSLEVTDVGDLVDYIYSFNDMSTLSGIPRGDIEAALKEHMKDGVLTVPKEYGMFIAGGEV